VLIRAAALLRGLERKPGGQTEDEAQQAVFVRRRRAELGILDV